MKARLAIPQSLSYPYAAVVKGLKNNGVEVAPFSEVTHDLLVTWSPWNGTYRDAESRKHRVVIVMENGWLSPLAGRDRLFQVALWGFNGTGSYLEGAPGRLQAIGVPPRANLSKGHGPWLVVAQRGGGNDPRSMPKDWPDRVVGRLKDYVPVNIHYRCSGETPFEVMERLRPRGVVTWSSSFSAWALWCGVPVFYCGPTIMTWRIAKRWHEDMPVPMPYEVDPVAVEREFDRLAWAQWTESEIAAGVPFKRLLSY